MADPTTRRHGWDTTVTRTVRYRKRINNSLTEYFDLWGGEQDDKV